MGNGSTSFLVNLQCSARAERSKTADSMLLINKFEKKKMLLRQNFL